jgi:acetoin utilization protein AcuB
MKQIPKLKTVMSPFPYWIEQTASLAEAEQLMAKHGVHHLPVKHDGKLVSIVTRNDIQLYKMSVPDSSKASVSAACVENAYVVDLNDSLDRVLRKMADANIGSALVVKEDRLAGVFTMRDACRLFAEYLAEQIPVPPSDGDDAA